MFSWPLFNRVACVPNHVLYHAILARLSGYIRPSMVIGVQAFILVWVSDVELATPSLMFYKDLDL